MDRQWFQSCVGVPFPLLRPLVHADVIDLHKLREDCCVIGITRLPAADRDVHNDEKLMVEDPFGRDVGKGQLEEFLIIEQPADLIFLPLEGIDMEVAVCSIGNGEIRPDAIPAQIAWRVDGAWIVLGVLPMNSRMSISPEAYHFLDVPIWMYFPNRLRLSHLIISENGRRSSMEV